MADGHSHQNNYIFIFNGTTFNAITNTVMSNLSASHENHHELLFEGKLREYITSNSTPHFKLDKNRVMNNSVDKSPLHSHGSEEHSHHNNDHVYSDHKNYYYYYVPLLILMLLFIYYIRRKK